MSFDEKYYSERKLKLQQREQRNIQKLMQMAFDFTAEQGDIREQWIELIKREEESKKAEVKKK